MATDSHTGEAATAHRRFRASPVRLLFVLIGCVLALLAAPAALALTGAPDPAFGNAGFVLTNVGGSGPVWWTVVRQADGKLVAGGFDTQPSADFRLARYHPDGSLDRSFGPDGNGTVSIDFSSGRDQLYGMAIDGAGRLVVAGDVQGPNRPAIGLARLSADGILDTGFGSGGKVLTELADEAHATTVAVDPNGNIVVGGYILASWVEHPVVMRYTDLGAPDAGFAGGLVTSGIQGMARQLVIDSSGRAVIAGQAWNGTDSDFLIERYLSDGTPDTSFNGTGRLLVDLAAAHDFGRCLVIDGNGDLVVAGTGEFNGLNSGKNDIALVRIHPDGTVDGGFGKVHTDLGASAEALALVVDSSGRIVVSGDFAVVGGPTALLMRYLATGALDPAFGNAGVVTTAFGQGGNHAAFGVIAYPDASLAVAGSGVAVGGSGVLARLTPSGAPDTAFGAAGVAPAVHFGLGNDWVSAMARQGDGKLVVAGWAPNGRDSDFALVRYHPDGAVDTGFGSDGRVLTDFGGHEDLVFAVAIDGLGRIVAAGVTYDGSQDNIAVARYLPDGTLDTAFGNGGRVTLDLGGDDLVRALAIDAAGRPVLAGQAQSGGSMNFMVLRLDTAGTPDPAFGSNGHVFIDFGAYDSAYGVTIDPNGRIVVAGWAASPQGFGVARLLGDGSLDAGFGGGGKVTTGIGTVAFAQAVAIDVTGRVVVAGYATGGPSGDDFVVARYLDDGSLDPGFGNAGIAVTDFAGGSDRTSALDASGNITVAGEIWNGSGYDFGVARFRLDGTPDPTFAGGKLVTSFPSGSARMPALVREPDGNLVLAGNSQQDFALVRLLGPAASTTVAASSGNPVMAGQPVTVTATVTGGAGTPIGTVTFRENGSDLPGCSQVALVTSGGQQQAACTLASPATGAHVLSIYYSGDATYDPSGTTLSQTVALALAPAALAGGTVGVGYSQSLAASGGTAAYHFSAGGALPPGLTLSATGLLAGTPTAAGSYSFTVTATDSTPANAGGPFSGAVTYSIVIAAGSQGLTFGALADRPLGSAPFALSASGGPSTQPVAFASATPACVTSGSNGATLTLMAVGTCTITASQAGDANYTAATPVTQSFQVTAPVITLAPGALPGAALGSAYDTSVSANGGFAPYTFAAAGGLPPGLSLAADGRVTGVPNAAGRYTFTITATDSASAGSGGPFSGSAVYTVQVSAAVPALAPWALWVLAAGVAAMALRRLEARSTR